MRIAIGPGKLWGLGTLSVFALMLCILFTPTITAHSQANSPPEFSSASFLLPSSENPAPNRPVGVPVVAIDPDPLDKISYSLSGEDAIFFDVSETSGQLESRMPLDYETRSSYQVEVRATDPRGLYDTASVNIRVTNVDEVGEVILKPITTNIGAGALATLTDPDGSLSHVSWQWAVSSDKTTWRNIEGGNSASYVPREEDLRQFLRAQANYSDGHGPGKVAATLFGPSLLKGNNHSPEFPFSESGTRTISPNASSGELVGPPMLAGDLDRDLLTYWLTGKASLFFEIGLHTGQLRTKGALNEQFAGRYFGEVHVFDGKGGNTTKVLRVDVGEIPASTSESTVGEESVPEGSPSTEDHEAPVTDSRTSSLNHQDLRLQVTGTSPAGSQAQVLAAEPQLGLPQPARQDPGLVLDTVPQGAEKPVAKEDPIVASNDELVASASILKPPPLLSLVEDTAADTAGPTGEPGQAGLSDSRGIGIGSLENWTIGLSLVLLMMAGVLLVASIPRWRQTREIKLPSPTVGPERRLGPLPILMSLREHGIFSTGKKEGDVETSP